MASELKFKSWEELFEFLEKIPVDIRLRYISVLLKRKLNKNIFDKLEDLKNKAQAELDALKLWKRMPSLSSQKEIIVERKEAPKKPALETIAKSEEIKKPSGIVEYGKIGEVKKVEYGVKKFEEKTGVKYSTKENLSYISKVETDYERLVSPGGIGSFKTSEDILKESERYKIKYKPKG